MYLSMPLFRSPDPSDLDAELLDRLLAGRVDPDDAPQAYKGVARVLAAATTAPTASEHAGEERAVRQFSQEASDGEPVRTARAARPLAAAAVMSLAILAGAGVAAAAGVLPTPAQRIAHSVLGHLGVDVPDPSRPGEHPPGATRRATSTTARATTTQTTCALQRGRCNTSHGTAVCIVASDGKCEHMTSPPPTHPTHPTHPTKPSTGSTTTTTHDKSGDGSGNNGNGSGNNGDDSGNNGEGSNKSGDAPGKGKP